MVLMMILWMIVAVGEILVNMGFVHSGLLKCEKNL